MKETGVLKKIYGFLLVAAYFMMVVGFCIRGEAWYDSFYFAFQSFFVEYNGADKENVFLYIGRVVCPLLTAAGVFVILRHGLKSIRDAVVSNLKNSTAVYYNTDRMKDLGKAFVHPVLMENKVNKKTDTHVLLFDKDVDCLTYYDKIKDKIKAGSKVYVCLEEIDSKLLNISDLFYFNTNEIIARIYWKERNLKEYLKEGKMDIKIAIIGFDSLGQKLLDYGLQNNIYSLKQSIQYHIWGDSTLYSSLLGKFDAMNGDTITYHDKDWRADIASFKEFDRIIIAQPVDVELLQALLYLNVDAEVDYYNPDGTDFSRLYKGKQLTQYGVLKNILKEDTIKTDALYREAKKINYNYLVKTNEKYTWERLDVEEVMEEKWKELDGFTKGSNVACADYHQIRLLVMDSMNLDIETISDEDMEMLAEMEHIRWSRYHYVNHWTYAAAEEMPTDENGVRMVKDAKRRKHSSLIPYKDLTRFVKDKDKNNVLELFGKV